MRHLVLKVAVTNFRERLRIDKVCNLHTYSSMHTVAELSTFRKAARAAGMSEQDIIDLVNHIAAHPDDGEEMEGTGGCRKLRFAIRSNNKGKRGGVRTITLFSGETMPVFLLTVFGKSQRANLSKAERNALKRLSEQIVHEYARRVLPLAGGERA